jgi:uncharacterized protein (TIGR03435 family)
MKKIALAIATLTVLAIGLAPPSVHAHSPGPLSFEVASVKPSAPPDPANPLTMVPMMVPGAGGSIRANNLPLRLLIRAAYKLEDEQIIGGPTWQLSSKFDITAKPADGAVATEDALRERLKALLADRFKLKTHTETREMTVSALMLARSDGKLGPNLKPSTADCSNAQEEAQKAAEEIRRNPANALSAMSQIKCGIVPMPTPGANGAPPQLMVRGMGQPIANLVSLVTQFTGRQVVDKTGLTGNYDFELELPLDMEVLRRVAGQAGVNLPAGPQQNLPAYDGPAMTTIISERLGLKLDTQKASLPVLVIDSAEMPTAD